MNRASPCPDEQLLQRLALGQLMPQELEALAQRQEQCERCADTLTGLKAEDTLVSAVRGQPAAHPPTEAVVEDLIGKLSGLRPRAEEGQTTAAMPPAAVPTGSGAHTFLAPAEGPDEIGRLDGYRVLKVLGQGGMGIVFLAEDVRLKRKVALKVMKPELAANAAACRRFLREAEATAAVRSDHVVTIYQVSEDRGVPFLAMEFLEGLPLDRWLQGGRKPTVAQVPRLGREIALGLAAAHERGLIHRDIKPANVWIEATHGGRVKLLDFGLARAVADDTHLTQSGSIVGTPSYMSPEQARGRPVDARTDLFSLGCVLYRLCAGQTPFRGSTTMAVLSALAMDSPLPVREVNAEIPPALAELVMRHLSKDPAGRPASARAAAEALQGIEREKPLAVRPQPAAAGAVGQVANLPAGRRPAPRLLVAAGLLFLLASALTAGIVVIIRDRQGKEVARATVPEGGSAKFKDDTKEQTAPKPGVPVAAAPLAALLPGEPLAPTALVQQPAKLPGVRSWSIETRAPVVPYAPVLAYSPDGKRLAAGNMDGVVRILDPETGRLVQVLPGASRVLALAWSGDGRVLAVGSEAPEKQPVCLWDAETGRLLRPLEAPSQDERIHSLAWSPDGASVTGLLWHGCCAWATADGKLLRTVPIAGVEDELSPDGRAVAAVRDDVVSVWDAETGRELRQLGPHHIGKGEYMTWSPDAKRLASTGTDALYVWEVETGKEVLQRKDLAGGGQVRWSADGRTLALTVRGQRARLVDVAADGPVRELEGPSTSMAWSPDGKTVALADARIEIHDVATGKQLRSLWEERGADVLGFALAPDGQTLAIADSSRTFLASADTGQVFTDLKDTTGPLAWSPDDKRLAAVGPNHTALLWEDGGKVRLTLTGHEADVSTLAWSPDGKRLASTAAGEKRVLVWDADKAERLGEGGPFAAPVLSRRWQEAGSTLTWSPVGRLLAFNVPDIGWHVWDAGQSKLANDPKQWKVACFNFAPDGHAALVVPGGNQPYELRDLATGAQPAARWQGGSSVPCWSPDGRLLALPGPAGVELWRADLLNRVRTLRGTLATVQQVAFSADGKLVAALAGERLHLWEADTGRLRGILLPGLGNNGLTISADGRYTGTEQVERGIVLVVRKDDGTQEVLDPAEFAQKYGFKNEPDKVRLAE